MSEIFAFDVTQEIVIGSRKNPSKKWLLPSGTRVVRDPNFPKILKVIEVRPHTDQWRVVEPGILFSEDMLVPVRKQV